MLCFWGFFSFACFSLFRLEGNAFSFNSEIKNELDL